MLNFMEQTLKKGMLDLNNMSRDTKNYLYSCYFSSKTNLNMSLEDKLELYFLICFLTFNLNKRFPDKFKNSQDVLLNYIYDGNSIGDQGMIEYIEGLGIVCDDLLWGVEPKTTPSQYKNSSEVKDRIKELISQWLPF